MAQYAIENGLLRSSRWKWAKRYQQANKKLNQLRRHCVNAARRKKRGPKFKFGYRVPRSIDEAYEIDAANGNTKWTDAIKKELVSIVDDNEVFSILKENEKAPEGYSFAPLLWTFDVKFDGCHRARMVGGGHVTDDLDHEECYSSTASLEDMRLMFVVAALMGLECVTCDVSHAYLQALTKEKIFTVAGKEFGHLAGRVLLLFKALYGFKTSGNRWHADLADVLRSLGFERSRAGNDIWMRHAGEYYDYILTVVGDLLIYSKEPMKIIEDLETRYNLKSVGTPEYYIGADLKKDAQGRWTIGSSTYLKNVCDKIESLYDTKLRNVGSPLNAGDHPETDESDFLTGEDITKYQMLCGCAQWAVGVSRLDAQYATNTMARYTSAPREGHEKRMLRVFGYLKYHLSANEDRRASAEHAKPH